MKIKKTLICLSLIITLFGGCEESKNQEKKDSNKRNLELEKIYSFGDRCDYVYLKGTDKKFSGTFISQIEFETIKTNFKNGLKHGEHVRLRNNGDTVAYALYDEGQVLKEIHFHSDARTISNNENIDIKDNLNSSDSLKVEEAINEFKNGHIYGYSSIGCSLDWDLFISKFGKLNKLEIKSIEKKTSLGYGKETIKINADFQFEKGNLQTTIFLDTQNGNTSKRPPTFTTFDPNHNSSDINRLIEIFQKQDLDGFMNFLPTSSEMKSQMEDFLESFEGIQSEYKFINTSYTCGESIQMYLVKVKTAEKTVNYILNIVYDKYNSIKHIHFDPERKEYSEVHVNWGK